MVLTWSSAPRLTPALAKRCALMPYPGSAGVAGPGDDEVAIGLHRDGRSELKAETVSVHPKLDAETHARVVEALGEDVRVVGVLVVAAPDDDEGAVAVPRHRR